MAHYIRATCPGGTFFFTLVTYDRIPIFEEALSRRLLRKAWIAEMRIRPFFQEAICLLPEHLHFVLRLPEGDSDFSTRISGIKARFTRAYLGSGHGELGEKRVRRDKGERAVWQRRYWEHMIRDDEDYRRHVDYVHYNPVKHGLVRNVRDWPWSSFHRYVKNGVYSSDWGSDSLEIGNQSFGE